MAVMILGGFPVIMDTTVVNVALPSILSGFETSLGRAQLVVSMYMIAIALVIPLTGYLADRLGEKTLYMICVCGFTAGSALCGIAWDINSLIFFRVIQGLAGGITMPLGIAMLFRAVPRNEIGAMTGWAGLVMVLAPVFGPLVSGYLVDTSSWRLVFWVNVPTGIIAVIMTRAILQDTDRITNLPFDYKGFVLAGVGFCTALLALTRVAQDGWTSNGRNWHALGFLCCHSWVDLRRVERKDAAAGLEGLSEFDLQPGNGRLLDIQLDHFSGNVPTAIIPAKCSRANPDPDGNAADARSGRHDDCVTHRRARVR